MEAFSERVDGALVDPIAHVAPEPRRRADGGDCACRHPCAHTRSRTRSRSCLRSLTRSRTRTRTARTHSALNESAPLAQTQQYIHDRSQFERTAVERTQQHAQSNEAQGAEPPAEEKAPLPAPDSVGLSEGTSTLLTGAEGEELSFLAEGTTPPATTPPADNSCTDGTSSKRTRLT